MCLIKMNECFEDESESPKVRGGPSRTTLWRRERDKKRAREDNDERVAESLDGEETAHSSCSFQAFQASHSPPKEVNSKQCFEQRKDTLDREDSADNNCSLQEFLDQRNPLNEENSEQISEQGSSDQFSLANASLSSESETLPRNFVERFLRQDHEECDSDASSCLDGEFSFEGENIEGNLDDNIMENDMENDVENEYEFQVINDSPESSACESEEDVENIEPQRAL
ncbi:Transcription factor BHLH062 [Frankliniella fusca]|uniref:Transcription factor BHLH062 n=1 Tax=Frankliniella fusca TaxID=407009 RepID=A0AAE1HVH5_9NEOP|nr:Transcription factor BHLH062 [Frankliniella fusca]